MRIVAPDAEGIALAVDALRGGEVVAYPTETVYGLAVDPFSPEAIARLFEVKGRDEGNPILLIVADEQQLSRVVVDVSQTARSYMRNFWPGPLSLLLPRRASLPEAITAGSDKVCVRCPNSETARRLSKSFGGPITSSSANRSGEKPAQSAVEIDLSGVAVVLDGGQLADSMPSTVFDPDTGQVFREGVISGESLRS